MKLNWNKKYTTIAVYAFLVIIASAACFVIFNQFGIVLNGINKVLGMLSPFFIGGAIAYILNFLLRFYEHILLKRGPFLRLSKKRRKTIAIALTYLTILVIIFAIMNYAVPQAVKSISHLIDNTPRYISEVIDWAEATFEKLNLSEEFIDEFNEKAREFLGNINNMIKSMLPVVGSFISSTMSKVTSFILGFIISIYILIEKEKFAAQSKMILYSWMSVDKANYTINLASRMHNLMKKFLLGQGLDTLIVAIVFFIVLLIMKVQYAGLLAFLLGVTNMIPWIGPWLGAIPAAIIILFQSPIKVIWFVIAALVIQQIDGNLLAPRIHGESLGVSGFWIIFAIVVGGSLFGFLGMLIGIPVFVLIYSLIREFTEKRLAKRNLPSRSAYYEDNILQVAEDEKENKEL